MYELFLLTVLTEEVAHWQYQNSFDNIPSRLIDWGLTALLPQLYCRYCHMEGGVPASHYAIYVYCIVTVEHQCFFYVTSIFV